MASFQALVLHEQDGKVAARVEAVDEALLPAGEVTVAIEYSTLNYKDGMILQGIGRLVRNYPHIPGIDFHGIVGNSRTCRNSRTGRPGDPDRLAGRRGSWGGFAGRRASRATGWCAGPTRSLQRRRWRSAPPASPRCWP